MCGENLAPHCFFGVSYHNEAYNWTIQAASVERITEEDGVFGVASEHSSQHQHSRVTRRQHLQDSQQLVNAAKSAYVSSFEDGSSGIQGLG